MVRRLGYGWLNCTVGTVEVGFGRCWWCGRVRGESGDRLGEGER